MGEPTGEFGAGRQGHCPRFADSGVGAPGRIPTATALPAADVGGASTVGAPPAIRGRRDGVGGQPQACGGRPRSRTVGSGTGDELASPAAARGTEIRVADAVFALSAIRGQRGGIENEHAGEQRLSAVADSGADVALITNESQAQCTSGPHLGARRHRRNGARWGWCVGFRNRGQMGPRGGAAPFCTPGKAARTSSDVADRIFETRG